ncbi:pentapeptide repeat-containing protein [Micromonospora sagamiensis]|uniref:pentapeptide repeat-containing protein n=1 Tax=Micromonospora sagamiensis TaxID=47875 RepID=UPI001E5AB538|nr:pentapeptide repeat-containing protein [Micromonospora sagamiensis]
MTRRISTVLAVLGGLGVAALVAVWVPAGWWAALAAHWAVLLLVVATVAALTASAVLRYRSGDRRRRAAEASAAPVAPDRPLRPLPSWVIPAGAVAVAAVTWLAVWGLQATLPEAGTQVQRAQLRVEGIRTGLTIGAGVTAAFALLLAFRRQQLAERTQQATEYDAGEKRVTELYVKAAEQLGSDKAPVRLAGLYALERLAQDNPAQRQSIVEVICAYLRMPYTPPEAKPTPEPADQAPAAEGSSGDGEKPTVDPREERQVRLAAQRILARHLRPETRDKKPDPSYWGPAVVLDLTEAVLLDVDFSDCHLHDATFTGAHFVGPARFHSTTFSGDARFRRATFRGETSFSGVTVRGTASFDRVTFSGGARFGGAMFGGDAWFGGVKFIGGTWFGRVMFSGGAGFEGAMFIADAQFDRAMFCGGAWFSGAMFGGDAQFGGVTFRGDAWFGRVMFSGGANFAGATLNGESYGGPANQ